MARRHVDQISSGVPDVGADPVPRTSRSPTSSSDGGDHEHHFHPQYKSEPGDMDSELEEGMYRHTIVELTLRVARYVVVVAVGLGLAVTYAGVSQHGLTLQRGVEDSIGSSKNAEQVQDDYNAVSGNLLIAISKVFEFYCEALIFPTLLTYLLNCPLFPGDQPHRVHSSVKHTSLFWAFRFILILMNVGTASIFVGHKAAGVRRFISTADLSTPSTNETLAAFASVSETQPVDVRNTVLRSVVDGYTRPFEINSECNIGYSYYQVASSTLSSTSVLLSFPRNDWNADFLPYGLTPNASVKFKYSDFKDQSSAWEAKLKDFDLDVAFELFVQGKVIYERGIADSALTRSYPCDATTGAYINPELLGSTSSSSDEDSTSGDSSASGSGSTTARNLQSATEYNDTKCQGTTSTLSWLQYLSNPGNLTWTNLLAEEVSGINDTFDIRMEVDDFEFGFATYNVTPEITLEVATIDFPLDGILGITTNESIAQLNPSFCGVDNCLLVYSTYQTEFRQELSLTNYVTGCDVAHLEYDDDLLNFFPSDCKRQDNTVMLYGLGTYLVADAFSNDANGNPQLESPRVFISLSFGKLAWRFTDLSAKYEAECTNGNTGCSGVSVPYNTSDKLQGVMLVGEKNLPTDYLNTSFKQPVRLVGLDQKQLPDLVGNRINYYYPNYINKANIASVTVSNNTDIWNLSTCDSMFDAYINYVEQNHLLLDKPLQPMYTSAFYYLLQNGVSTTLNKTDTSQSPLGKLLLTAAGALEKKNIEFRIPIVSASITFGGCVILLLLLVCVLQFPTERVKRSPNTTAAAQYVAISTDNDQYPDLVHKKRLRFPNGDVLLMNDYVVDQIVLAARRDNSKRLYL